ncbi:MAG: ATP-binding cassette domain-containing protein, partial [Bacteroidota bacterium]
MSISLVDEFIIQVQDADIYQNEFQVLRQVNFNIRKGEFTYLIGRTGSGKTSLIKTLYAELPFSVGQISIAGYSLKNITRKEIPFLRRKL